MNPADLGNASSRPATGEPVLCRLTELLHNLSNLESNLELCRAVVEGPQPREASAQPADAYPLSSVMEVLGIAELTLSRCGQALTNINCALGESSQCGQGRQ